MQVADEKVPTCHPSPDFPSKKKGRHDQKKTSQTKTTTISLRIAKDPPMEGFEPV